MKLFDIYVNKKNNNLIQIDSFASHINNISEKLIVVFKNIENHGNGEIGSCPSFNGFGTQEEIESKYELFIAEEDLKKYKTWEDIFESLDKFKKKRN